MTLAQRLHEAIHQLPMSYVQTALLGAQYPHWSEEAFRTYVRAMPRAQLEQAFVILCRTVAGHSEQKLDGDYPPNGADT